MEGRKTRRTGMKLAAIVLLWLPLLEITALVGTGLLQHKGLLYQPDRGAGYEEYMAMRDPFLGWPSPSIIGKGEWDTSGSRVVPSHPLSDSDPARVSFYGDSFTWGDDVTPAEAFPNRVAEALRVRVNNFGVPAYGTDQAFLRYRRNAADKADWVVLGHFSEDIVRNVNQYRDYLGSSRFGLKPRFVLDDGAGLRLIPIPSPTLEQYQAIAAGDPVTLDNEWWSPGGPGGIVTRRFPYSLSALRFFGQSYRLAARLRGVPSYAALYDPAHPSHALAITERILQSFVKTAEERGQKPLVLLLPDAKDLQALRQHGRLPYQPLIDALRADGIEPLDVSAQLDALAGKADPETLLGSRRHYTPQAYAEVARAVAARITLR